MPNWKVHLEVAKRISKKLNLNKKEHDLFLFGNILPDINNGYLVKDVSRKIDHEITHFVMNDKPSYENFFDEYHEQIKEDILLLGYFSHLYVDYKFNNNFYTTYREQNIDKYPRTELRIIKQSEFKIYNNKYIDNFIDTEEYEKICNATKFIEVVDVDCEDVRKTIEALKEIEVYNGEYVFYSEEELDNLLEKTVETLCKRIDEVNIGR